MGFLRDIGHLVLFGAGVALAFTAVESLFGGRKVQVIHKERDEHGNVREIQDTAKYGIGSAAAPRASHSQTQSYVCQGEYTGWTECLSRLGSGDARCEKYYEIYNNCLRRNGNM
jgi:hypothetical protein